MEQTDHLNTQLKTVPFTVFLTSKYIFYFVFLFVGIRYNESVIGWIPMFLFYIFQYIGIFLISNINYKEKISTLNMLKLSTLLSVIGCAVGLLAVFNINYLIFSSILIGIGTSAQAVLFATQNMHILTYQAIKHRPSIQIPILVFTLVSTLFSLYYASRYYFTTVFLVFLVLFSLALANMYLLKVDVDSSNSSRDRYSIMILVLSAFIMFIARATRTQHIGSLYFAFIFLLMMTLALIYISIKRIRQESVEDQHVHILGMIISALVSYFFIFGTFYMLSQYGSSYLISNIFVPYIIGLIASHLPLYPLFKYLRSRDIFLLLMLLLGVATAGLIFKAFIISGFLIGFAGSYLSNRLTIFTYFNSSYALEERILIKSRWQLVGSIISQSSIIIIIIISAFLYGSSTYPLFKILTTHDISTISTAQYILNPVGIILSSILILLFSYSVYSVRKDLTTKLF